MTALALYLAMVAASTTALALGAAAVLARRRKRSLLLPSIGAGIAAAVYVLAWGATLLGDIT